MAADPSKKDSEPKKRNKTKKVYELGLEDKDRLAENLGGGLPRGCIGVIEAEYGGGKSSMSQRFAYGFCEEGYNVTYVSTELDMKAFLQQMKSLGYGGIRKHILFENLLFLPAYLDEKSNEDLLTRLMDTEKMWKSDIIIIDTFDAILRNDKKFENLIKEDEERQGALEIITFFRKIASQNKTLVLTIDPTTLNKEALSPFRGISDVHLEIGMEEIGNQTRRFINIKRFSGMGEQVGDSIGFDVRADMGIVIESREVA